MRRRAHAGAGPSREELSAEDDDATKEPDMFGNDVDFLLSLHRTHAAELRAEAAAERLARAVPRRAGRTWMGRRQSARHTGDDRR
jgi:hypothetical protein